MIPRFRRGDHIITNHDHRGRIKDITVDLNCITWYTISWDIDTSNPPLSSQYMGSDLKLDIQRSRNDKLSKILDK